MAFQQQASPMVKAEASPAESFLSMPGDNYQSLFPPTTPSSTTVNPLDMMTPQSHSDDKQTPQLPAIPEQSEESVKEQTPEEEDDDDESPEGSDKKPTKKRKSWGQVLPEPKTNLPPRKRAKTEDEKEQRRVERVLRNRRAAQSSRERKRLEVEALERRNKELETMLVNAQKANLILVEELNRFRHDSGVVSGSSSPLNSLRDNPITLSQELFSSQDGHNVSNESAANLVDQLIRSTANPTVNPASLSPELSPVLEAPKASTTETQSSEENSATSPDLTQRPAVSHVGGDAQIVSGLADSDVTALGLGPAAQDDAAFSLGDSFGLSEAIDTDRYVLESGLLASPNSSTFDDDYMVGDSAAGLSNQSAFDLFNIDDFLNNDEANHVASDIMAASDYAAADHGLEPKVYDSEIQVS